MAVTMSLYLSALSLTQSHRVGSNCDKGRRPAAQNPTISHKSSRPRSVIDPYKGERDCCKCTKVVRRATGGVLAAGRRLGRPPTAPCPAAAAQGSPADRPADQSPPPTQTDEKAGGGGQWCRHGGVPGRGDGAATRSLSLRPAHTLRPCG